MKSTEVPVTRYRRDRNSSWWVRVSDRIAKQVITIGGIGTILVVLLVVLVLLGNVLPMFQANRHVRLGSFSISKIDTGSGTTAHPIACGVDEFSEIIWILHVNEVLTIHSISTGEQIGRHHPPSNESDPAKGASETKSIVCCSVADNDSSMLAGYSDGTVRPITLSFDVEFTKATELPTSVSQSMGSDVSLVEGILYRKMSSGVIRKLHVKDIVFHPSIKVSEKPIRNVDWRTPQVASSFDDSQTWSWGATDGEQVALGLVENKVNSFSGNSSQESKTWKSTNLSGDSNQQVLGLMVNSRSDQIQSVDARGRVKLWSPQDDGSLKEIKSHPSLASADSKPTVVTPLLGRSTVMIGSESGHIESVALTATENGQELLSIHRFAGDLGSVKNIAASPEGRLIATQFESGDTAIYYVPTNTRLLHWKDSSTKLSASDASDSSRLFFSANAAAVGVIGDSDIDLWSIEIPFPEASISSFFGRIWYEGYQSPQYVWQSSTGTVEGEYKFGFMPLIFGTLKATFYSMLIGAPIALMAAIFGSEFMNSRWRARVKPFIELMASVPSVVLGFIGALVLAPILRDNLMFVLLSAVSILFLFLFAAHLWLIIPGPIAIRLNRFRLPILFTLIPIGIGVANWFSPSVERLLFGGNLILWLSNRDGSGWSGWFCLALLPVSLLVTWFVSAPLSPMIQSYARSTSPLRFSLINLGVFVGACGLVLVIASVVGFGLSSVGLDPRASVLGAYQERNALLVGAILGFAIIPLIYTISEDALQSVPQHLRSASLGCGATTWQTTIRVVVPTAMSGLFSALMIGFGRAVGETMVVLMAAGNTPVMDINPLNGYRTLSATLATELPEAARGSTHFHALFLAALLLFCFTMAANTVAEIVRMRFRKRAFQL